MSWFSILFLTLSSHRQAGYLKRFWVADKSAYVLETSSGGSLDVREFVETARGVHQNGQPLSIKDFVIGSGPGLGDSLLLLCKDSDDAYRVIRVVHGSKHKVCDLRHFTTRIDPEITLRETKDCIILEDPTTQGDSPDLNIWVYRSSWAGPLRTDGGDAQLPINADRTVRVQFGGWGKRGDPFWNVQEFRPNHEILEWGWAIPNKMISLKGDSVDDLTPIQIMSSDWLAFYVHGKKSSWIITYGSTYQPTDGCKLDVLQEKGKSQLHDDGVKQNPLFRDSRGRFWALESDHTFHRVAVKLIRLDRLGIGWSNIMR